jgi:hypothetical protein
MYIDSGLKVMDAQTAYTTAAALIYSASSVDVGNTGRYSDLGKGQPVAMKFAVTTAFAGTTGCLFTFQIRADVDLTIDASSVILAETGPLEVTSLTKGTIISIPFPAGVQGSTYDHIGASILTTVQNGSAGAVDAWVAFGDNS